MNAQHLLLIFNFVIWTVLMASVESQIDGFKLVYIWPVSYCNTLREQNCSPDLPEKFTIHGLWAFNRSGIINCPTPYPIPQLKSLGIPKLENGLHKIWINHTGEPSKENNYRFWNYEWSRHGSCLNSGDRVIYFRNVSNFHTLLVSVLFPHSNLFPLLDQEGFPPGGHYKPQDILDKIYQRTYLVAELKCSRKVKNMPVELREVSFCLNVEGSFVNCNKPSQKKIYHPNDCNSWGSTKSIYFPKPASKPQPPQAQPIRILKSNAPPPPTRPSLKGDLVIHPQVRRLILLPIWVILFIGLCYIVRLYINCTRTKFVKNDTAKKSTVKKT